MALHGVLSAMREIILDLREIPPTASERATFFRTRFPTLSGDEVADLAAIPPNGWRTYTHSIFAGQRNLLTRYFPVTFALLQRHWGEFSASPFSPLEIVRAAHTLRPWHGRTSAKLAELFVEYLTIDRRDITAIHPEIEATARLEVVTPSLRHLADDPFGPRDSLTLADLTSRTVGEVLELDYYVPSSVRFQAFEFDIPTLRHRFFANDRRLPESIEPCPTWSIASRNRDGLVRWTNISAPLYRFLESRPRTERRKVEELATAFVETATPESSETELFGRFVRILGALLEEGALLILPPA